MTGLDTDPRVRYALSVLLNQDAAGFTAPSWLSYGPASAVPAGSRVHVVASGFFGEAYGTAGALPHPPLPVIDKVPVLFGEPRRERVDGTIVVHADIVASAFVLTTRYEEWVRPGVRDAHGRFPGRESIAARARCIERPVVDDYARLLRVWAAEAGVTVPAPARQFSVLLTHDVDSLGPARGFVPALAAVARSLIGRVAVGEGLRDAAWAAGLGSHPRDNLADVMALDAGLIGRAGPERCRAMYFFFGGGGTEHDAKYRIDSRWMARRVRAVQASGASIGMHTSYAAGADAARIDAERRALGRVTGQDIDANRHHFLRWREVQHGEALQAAGIRWDSTLGYPDVAGFRLGVCRPIALFDPVGRRLLGIEEHPLIVMDCTLDSPEYMHLDEAAALDCVCRLANAVHEHQGEFVMLWHNTELGPSAHYHPRVYRRALAHLAELMGCA